MKMTWKQHVQRMFKRCGYDLRRYNPSYHPEARRMRLFAEYGIDLVLDVGANDGEFALELRENGYGGRIVSFEPVDDAFRRLEQVAAGAQNWTTRKLALGERAERANIQVAGNSTSSSLLPMLPSHMEAAPQAAYVGQQEITVETLDRIFPSISTGHNSVWLKVDTQGYEGAVIRGGTLSLPKIDTVQLEVSLIPLYDGALSFPDILSMMENWGYVIVGIDTGFCNPETGQLLQADVTFHRYRQGGRDA